MMRPVTVHVAGHSRDAPSCRFTRGSVILNWTDGTPVDYANPATWGNSERPRSATASSGPRSRTASPAPDTEIANAPANTTTYTDYPPDPTLTYDYRVTAWNAAGDSPSNVITVEGLPKAPTALTADVQPVPTLPAGAQVALDWTNNATNAAERRRRARRAPAPSACSPRWLRRHELRRPDGRARRVQLPGQRGLTRAGSSAYAVRPP